MKLSKLCCVVMSVFMLATILVGCSGDQDQENSPSNSETNQPEVEKTVVQMSMWDAINEDYNFIEAFNNSQQEIELEVVTIPESYSEKINAMVASNTEPDIMIIWECDVFRFIDDDIIIKLDDYVNSGSLADEALIPAVSEFTSLTGGTYGLPWCYASECLFYNKDMFDAADVSYPTSDWTMDDFAQAAEKLTIKDGNMVTQYGADAVSGSNWFALIGAYGDEIVNSDGKLAIGDGARNALTFMKDLTDRGIVPGPSSDTSTDLFAAEKVAMTRAGTWMISVYRDIENFNWDIAAFPKAEREYSSMHTGLFSISSRSENKDAAWKVIEFMFGDTGQELICKAYSNMSTRVSINEKGYHKVSGTMGPTNWDALDQVSSVSYIGYPLLNTGLSTDIGQKFGAVMLGQLTIDEAIQESLDESALLE